jgi:outer membrane protein assembly factor BamB
VPLLLAAAATAQETEIRALLPGLGAADYQAREEAERDLEALVRKGGRESFDLLETKILPEVRAGGDAEIALRVGRVVDRLGTVRLLWWTTFGPCPMWRPRIAAAHGLVVRTGESGLDVLDARTGSQIWSKSGTFQNPMAGITQGVVYASRPPDAVAAYRASSGEPVWIHEVTDIGGDSGRTHSVGLTDGKTFRKETRPLPPGEWTDFHMETLHVPEWDRTIVVTTGGHVAALDAKGLRLWSTDVAHGKWAATGFPTVATDPGLVFTSGFEEGLRLVALDVWTGGVRWDVPVEGLNGMAGRVSKGRLFVTASPTVDGRIDGRLHAFDAKTGERIWTFKPPVAAAGKAQGDEVVEIRSGNRTIRQGQISWPGDETRMWQAWPVAEGDIVITEVPSRRFGLRASTGEVIWSQPADGRLGAAEKDGFLWGTSGGEIIALAPRDGTLARRIDLMKLEAAEDAPKLAVRRGDHVPAEGLGDLSSPVFDGDVCYLTTASGWTIALRVPPFQSHAAR